MTSEHQKFTRSALISVLLCVLPKERKEKLGGVEYIVRAVGLAVVNWGEKCGARTKGPSADDVQIENTHDPGRDHRVSVLAANLACFSFRVASFPGFLEHLIGPQLDKTKPQQKATVRQPTSTFLTSSSVFLRSLSFSEE